MEQELEQATIAVKKKVTTATDKASLNVKAALESLAQPPSVQLSKAAELVESLLPPVKTHSAPAAGAGHHTHGQPHPHVGSPHAVPSTGVPVAAAMSPLVLVFASTPRDEDSGSETEGDAAAPGAGRELDEVPSGAGSSADDEEGPSAGGPGRSGKGAGPSGAGAGGSGSGSDDDDGPNALDGLVDEDEEGDALGAEAGKQAGGGSTEKKQKRRGSGNAAPPGMPCGFGRCGCGQTRKIDNA